MELKQPERSTLETGDAPKETLCERGGDYRKALLLSLTIDELEHRRSRLLAS